MMIILTIDANRAVILVRVVNDIELNKLVIIDNVACKFNSSDDVSSELLSEVCNMDINRIECCLCRIIVSPDGLIEKIPIEHLSLILQKQFKKSILLW